MLRSSEPWERDSTARLAGISVGNDPAGDRTQDLRIKSPLLYQLSYRVGRGETSLHSYTCTSVPHLVQHATRQTVGQTVGPATHSVATLEELPHGLPSRVSGHRDKLPTITA